MILKPEIPTMSRMMLEKHLNGDGSAWGMPAEASSGAGNPFSPGTDSEMVWGACWVLSSLSTYKQLPTDR